MLKLTIRTILLLSVLLLASARYADAQGLSAYFGLGSANNSAGTTTNVPSGLGDSAGGFSCLSHELFDDFTGFCEPAPTMGGVFGVFGADFMFRPRFGVNGEYAFRFAQADYLPFAGLKDRPGFYDFNAVWIPTDPSKRIVPVVEGGIGGAKVSLYISQTATVTGISTTQSQFFASANHFQLHAAVGVKLYFTDNAFIKPQFDLHWVDNLNQQFGRDWVPQYTVSVGYTFGSR